MSMVIMIYSISTVLEPIGFNPKVTRISSYIVNPYYSINYVKYDIGILSPRVREYLEITYYISVSNICNEFWWYVVFFFLFIVEDFPNVNENT